MLSEYIAKYPKAVVFAILVSLIFSGYYAAQMKIGVDTGRFELKNNAYKTYEKIVDTFGTEGDNVIIVGVSKTGYALHKENILNALKLEENITNETPSLITIQSPADYVAMGLKLLSIQDSLPDTLNISLNESIFDNIEKMKDAIAEYRYVNETADNDTKNATYQIFALLPRYAQSPESTDTADESGAAFYGMLENFSFAVILNSSAYKDTRLNATEMLIQEIEIYQNITRYGNDMNGSGVLMFQVPENYSVDFVNKTIDDVRFNITKCDIAMENYNTSFFEWYSYNITLNFAKALLFSGYDAFARGVYETVRSAMLNASRGYYNQTVAWRGYLHNLTLFKNDPGLLQNIINETEDRRNESRGTLRDYLTDYLNALRDYQNGTIKWGIIYTQTLRTENVSSLMIDIYTQSRNYDVESLPVLNATIAAIGTPLAEQYAIKLCDMSEDNMNSIARNIGMYYGEKLLLKKVEIILENLKSILMRDESPEIKQAAWNLIDFGGAIENEQNFDVEPFYRALTGYRYTLNTTYWYNTTKLFWDYLTLKNFTIQQTYSEFPVDTNMSFSRQDLLEYMRNVTQNQIDDNITRMKNYSDAHIEAIVHNYTKELSNLTHRLSSAREDLNTIKTDYEELCGAETQNLSAVLSQVTANISDAEGQLHSAINDTYSLRMIENYFEDADSVFNTLISKDGIAFLIIVVLEDPDDEWAVVRSANNYSSNVVEYHPLASKVLVHQIEATAKKDMSSFLPISMILLFVLLYFTYGNIKQVLLSLSAVIIVMVWLFAFSTLIGWNFDPILLAVPIMLVGIGIDDGIYVTLRYREERETKDPRKAAMITVASVGGALVLTTVTSMAGFMSNTLSSMEDLQRFGFLAAVGLFFSFVAMTTYLPAMNLIFDPKGKGTKTVHLKTAEVGAYLADKNPYIAIGFALILAIAGVVSLTHINTEFNIKDLAPQDSEIIQYYHYYQKNFNASVEISYIYMEGNLTSPEVLKAMSEVEKNIQDDSCVVHQYSVVSPWSIMEKYAYAKRGEIYYDPEFIKAFNESDVNGDGFPDRNISYLYKLLRPEIDSVLKGDRAIIIIHTDSEDLKRVNLLINELREDAKPLEKYVNVTIAGDAIVSKASLDEINENQIRSLTISILFAIAVLIILFFITKRSITLGIIAAIPIMLVVTWNWLLMYILGISLNVMTNTIASLCVGLGVDYGIHITHRFVEESNRYYDLSRAVHRATGRIGRGLIGAAMTTIASIGILVFSSIPPLSNFALILAFSIFSAFIASLLVLPSLLILWARKRRKMGIDAVEREVRDALKNGDAEVLCRYHVSIEDCIAYICSLIKDGKIIEARKLIEDLKDEGIDLTYLLRSDTELWLPFE